VCVCVSGRALVCAAFDSRDEIRRRPTRALESTTCTMSVGVCLYVLLGGCVRVCLCLYVHLYIQQVAP